MERGDCLTCPCGHGEDTAASVRAPRVDGKELNLPKFRRSSFDLLDFGFIRDDELLRGPGDQPALRSFRKRKDEEPRLLVCPAARELSDDITSIQRVKRLVPTGVRPHTLVVVL